MAEIHSRIENLRGSMLGNIGRVGGSGRVKEVPTRNRPNIRWVFTCLTHSRPIPRWVGSGTGIFRRVWVGSAGRVGYVQPYAHI